MAKQENENDTPINPSFDELAFVNAYFEENMNATRAYMKLHPKASYESARASASETLTKVNIKVEITRRLNANAMTAEEALFRLGEMARAELMPFIHIDEDGFAWFNLADKEAKKYMWLIKEMETKRERRIEGKGKEAETWEGEWVRVKLHDAQAALRDILKMHGRFIERVEVGGKLDQTITVRLTHDDD